MLLTIIILAALLSAAVGICVAQLRDTDGWLWPVGTLLVIVSLMHSVGHAAFASDH